MSTLRSLRLRATTADTLDRLSGTTGELFYDSTNQTLRIFANSFSNDQILATRTWVNSILGGGAGGGANVEVGPTPPVEPNDGDLWLNTENGKLYAYVDDGNSQQWMQPSGGEGPQGPQGPAGATGPQGPAGSDANTVGLASEEYVDTAISNIPTVDLTGYATETYVTNNTVASVNGDTGVITGIATLGEDGKLSADQIPSSLAAALVYKGTWNAVTNTPPLTNGTGTAGWQYAVGVGGTHDFGAGEISFNPGDALIYNGTAWEKVPSNTVAAAGTLTGDTINATVVNSSLTSVGTLTNLTVTNTISGTVTNGVVTSGSYTDPSWLTITATKVGLGNVTNESKATMFTNPTLTGTTVAPTPTAGNSSTQIATTAYVQTAGYNSQGVKTVSTGDPTGGADGDVWYKYV